VHLRHPCVSKRGVRWQWQIKGRTGVATTERPKNLRHRFKGRDHKSGVVYPLAWFRWPKSTGLEHWRDFGGDRAAAAPPRPNYGRHNTEMRASIGWQRKIPDEIGPNLLACSSRRGSDTVSIYSSPHQGDNRRRTDHRNYLPRVPRYWSADIIGSATWPIVVALARLSRPARVSSLFGLCLR